MSCQIVHDSLHSRTGWTEPYLLLSGGVAAGYGSIAVGGPWQAMPSVFEFERDREPAEEVEPAASADDEYAGSCGKVERNDGQVRVSMVGCETTTRSRRAAA